MNESEKKKYHKEIDDILLDDLFVGDQSAVDARASEYFSIHRKDNDCHILAEAEIGDAEVLLTYDQRMLKRLRNKTKSINLLSPTEYWAQLNVPVGSRPYTSPSESNPLTKESWWLWK
jgi:predicted nucleic acid-binding protein